MKIACFHLMPYRDLPADFEKKYKSACREIEGRVGAAAVVKIRRRRRARRPAGDERESGRGREQRAGERGGDFADGRPARDARAREVEAGAIRDERERLPRARVFPPMHEEVIRRRRRGVAGDALHRAARDERAFKKRRARRHGVDGFVNLRLPRDRAGESESRRLSGGQRDLEILVAPAHDGAVESHARRERGDAERERAGARERVVRAAGVGHAAQRVGDDDDLVIRRQRADERNGDIRRISPIGPNRPTVRDARKHDVRRIEHAVLREIDRVAPRRDRRDERAGVSHGVGKGNVVARRDRAGRGDGLDGEVRGVHERVEREVRRGIDDLEKIRVSDIQARHAGERAVARGEGHQREILPRRRAETRGDGNVRRATERRRARRRDAPELRRRRARDFKRHAARHRLRERWRPQLSLWDPFVPQHSTSYSALLLISFDLE